MDIFSNTLTSVPRPHEIMILIMDILNLPPLMGTLSVMNQLCIPGRNLPLVFMCCCIHFANT